MTTTTPGQFVRGDVEVVAKITRTKNLPADVRLNAFASRLMTVLPFNHVKQWLNPTATEAAWDQEVRLATMPELRVEIETFLIGVFDDTGAVVSPGAWDRANQDKQPFEAQRNCGHIAAFCWIMGADHEPFVDELLNEQQLDFFGKHHLVRFCELDAVNYPWRDLDNDKWPTIVRDERVMVTAAEAMKKLQSQ